MAQATTNQNIDFAVGDAGDDATHFTLWTELTGGTLLWSSTLSNNPVALVINQFYRLSSGAITLTLTIGTDGATEAMARRAFEGMIAGTTYIQFHDGPPGSSGTDNIVTDARVAIAEDDWDVT